MKRSIAVGLAALAVVGLLMTLTVRAPTGQRSDPFRAMNFRVEIDGVVVQLPFHEGSAVEKGGLIAQLDDAQLRAEVARTEALRDQSQSTYNRVKAVVDQGAGAPQDLDDAAAALKVAEANLALARSRLSKTSIVAPFSGVLGARRVSPGAFLRAGQPITDLAKLDELRVNFSAPERYLGQLRKGAEVSISTTAYPGYVLRGRIDVVDPVLDPVETRGVTAVEQACHFRGLPAQPLRQLAFVEPGTAHRAVGLEL